MDKKRKNCWRFTLVNRFTLEVIPDVYTFGIDVVRATSVVRKLFPSALYDVEDVMLITNSSLVIVGYSNLEDLL